MITKYKIASAIATGSLLLSCFAPAAFATSGSSIDISRNGAGSTAQVDYSSDQSSTIVQNNDAYISNNISSNQNTGGNSASFNTGGDVVVDTGNATSRTEVSNMANMNQANISGCGSCTGGSTDINVSGNGAFSDTNISADNGHDSSIYQDNNLRIRNDISNDQNTGKNDASFNTGGDTRLYTGHADSNVMVDNIGNANIAGIGGSGSGTSGTSSIDVSGNGAFSGVRADLSDNHSATIVQNNDADIRNDIRNRANTGKNDMSFNTGGDNWMDTGNAMNRTTVDNLANFNAASLDCGCMTGSDTRIEGNGAFSNIDLNLNNNHDRSFFQDNRYHARNNVDNDSYTGHNDSGYTTGGNNRLYSGHTGSDVSVSSLGNHNTVGNMGSFQLPGGNNLHLSFDMMKVMHMMNGWM